MGVFSLTESPKGVLNTSLVLAKGPLRSRDLGLLPERVRIVSLLTSMLPESPLVGPVSFFAVSSPCSPQPGISGSVHHNQR